MKLITTAIDYANGLPHIGHAYEKVLADAIARKTGAELFMGMDEHGSKVQQAAKKLDIEPQAYVDAIEVPFKSAWKGLEVVYTHWCKTTSQTHIKCVQEALQKLYDMGLIYKGKYQGWYTRKEERYIRESEKIDFPDAEWLSEDAWLFNLDRNAKSITVTPSHHLKKLALPDFGHDLCISRKKTAVSWGIELPFDNTCVAYVWFDALLCYISSTGGLFGADTLHIIGKDIWFPAHGVYWISMLNALQLPVPQFLIHGWWLSGNKAKMSKSLGNSQSLHELIGRYGSTPLRWYLLSAGVGQDVEFDEHVLVAKYEELSNNIGNLSNRVAALIRKYGYEEVLSGSYSEKLIEDAWKEYDTCKVEALILEYSRAQNVHIDETKLWDLVKTDEAGGKFALGMLRNQILRIAKWLTPIIPEAANRIVEQMTDFSSTPVFPKLV